MCECFCVGSDGGRAEAVALLGASAEPPKFAARPSYNPSPGANPSSSPPLVDSPGLSAASDASTFCDDLTVGFLSPGFSAKHLHLKDKVKAAQNITELTIELIT
mmetsp:Transcript_43918/g.108659  ORF Transcript_43918/g.108659 Transcript_43918/m.108659 type:complete len:104 (-) Transcript_43918:93-404(-)